MEPVAEQQVLENEQKAIEMYLDHPISRRIFADNASEQETCINLILERPVINVETFLAREQALGHLRGLRRAKAILQDDLEEIKEKLKEIR